MSTPNAADAHTQQNQPTPGQPVPTAGRLVRVAWHPQQADRPWAGSLGMQVGQRDAQTPAVKGEPVVQTLPDIARMAERGSV